MFESNSRITRRQALAGAASAAAVAALAPNAAFGAAPMLGASVPTHYRFKLGEFEVTALAEGVFQTDGPHPIFGENQKPEAVEALMGANNLPPKRMQISFMPFLVNTGKEVVLFDAGFGPGVRPMTGRLAAALQAAGYSADQVDLVVITHCHQDHISGLIVDGKPSFPNARYMISEAEYKFWTSDAAKSDALKANAEAVAKKVTPLIEKTAFIKDGSDVAAGIRAIDASGHTPGHLAFNIESGGKRLFAWVDCAHHAVISLQHPEWHLRFDMDKEKGVATRKRFYDMAATDRIPVIGYHMPFPGAGYVEKSGAAYRWTPVLYQLEL